MIYQKLIIAAVVIVLATFTGWTARGWKEGEKYQSMVADINRQKVEALDKAATETASLKSRVEQIDIKRTQENRDAQTKINGLMARLRAGTVSLSIPAHCPAQVPGTAGDTGMGDGTARAELDGTTSADLIAITGDGDSAISQLNTCQDILDALVAK